MNKLSRNQWIAIVVAVVIVVWFFASSSLMVSLLGQNNDGVNTNNNFMMENQQVNNAADSSIPGLVIVDEVVGSGDQAEAGKMITANYTGMFENGTIFDTSIGRAPFTFPLGQGLVIQGWDKGIVGMKVGGKRRLTISPELGYGFADMKDRAGNIVIPASSTLIFEVELLEVK